jgi:hypothetical protein
MRVFDLCCGQGHQFEGWFGSEDDYVAQQQRGLVSCPMCESAEIARRPSAPRLNLRTARGSAPESGAQTKAKESSARVGAAAGPANSTSASVPEGALAVSPEAAPPEVLERLKQVQSAYLGLVQQVLSNTEDVGQQFADEARRIHYGEAEERGIRGQTTPEEAAALSEEGINVFSLPVPAGMDKPRH